MTFEETFEELNRRGVGFRITEDFRIIAKPKERLTPELRKAIKRYKGRIACLLVWDAYMEWAGVDADDAPPWSPAMRECCNEGRPEEFYRALKDYDLVHRNWQMVKGVLATPGGSGLIIGRNHGGLIAVLPPDYEEPYPGSEN